MTMPSLLELVAVALGIANIALLIRRSIWNYPFALAMVTLYAFIFFEAKLYSDTLLQGFFFLVNVAGWMMWRRAGGDAGPVQVERLSIGARAAWICATLVATGLWGWLMHRYTDAASPWWDAAVAMGSVAAQILLTQRKIENWYGWIVVDVLAVGLYASRGLWLTSGLYAVLLIMCIVGFVEWRHAERERV